MQQAARYLFDLDFAAPPEPEIEETVEEIPPEPMITVAEHERLLAEAVDAARAEGEAKARDNREQLASEETLRLQKAMIDEIGMIYTEVGTLLERLKRDSSNLAFAFASRFAERLVAQEPKTEIQALLNQILAPLRKTPHISIRLSEEVAEDIQQAVDQQMQELGFSGKLSVIPDPAMMPGDCEVEWADGGIGRNLRSAIRQVEQLLDDHFAHVPEDEEDETETANGEEETAEASSTEADTNAPTEPTGADDATAMTDSAGGDLGDGADTHTPSEDQTAALHTETMDATQDATSEPLAEHQTSPSDVQLESSDEMMAATAPMQMETSNE